MSATNEESYKKPLTKQFYSVLLKFEEKASKKEISIDELSSMTRMYGEIVSYYDALMDPIKYYFMEKLQGFLSEIVFQAKAIESERQATIATPERRISITTMKKTRQKKLTHLIQLQEVQKEQPTQFEQLLGDYLQNTNDNDQSIKQQLSVQGDKISSRLENRKQNRQLKKNASQLSQFSQCEYESESRSSVELSGENSPLKNEQFVIHSQSETPNGNADMNTNTNTPPIDFNQ